MASRCSSKPPGPSPARPVLPDVGEGTSLFRSAFVSPQLARDRQNSEAVSAWGCFIPSDSDPLSCSAGRSPAHLCGFARCGSHPLRSERWLPSGNLPGAPRAWSAGFRLQGNLRWCRVGFLGKAGHHSLTGAFLRDLRVPARPSRSLSALMPLPGRPVLSPRYAPVDAGDTRASSSEAGVGGGGGASKTP